MFHRQNSSITTGNYDKHIKSLQDLIAACNKALVALVENKLATPTTMIVVKNLSDTELFSKNRQDLQALIRTQEDNIRILELMRAGNPITTGDFEQVTKLYDVRRDPTCFCYRNVLEAPKP